jgi:hypothetical protein
MKEVIFLVNTPRSTVHRDGITILYPTFLKTIENHFGSSKPLTSVILHLTFYNLFPIGPNNISHTLFLLFIFGT